MAAAVSASASFQNHHPLGPSKLDFPVHPHLFFLDPIYPPPTSDRQTLPPYGDQTPSANHTAPLHRLQQQEIITTRDSCKTGHEQPSRCRAQPVAKPSPSAQGGWTRPRAQRRTPQHRASPNGGPGPRERCQEPGQRVKSHGDAAREARDLRLALCAKRHLDRTRLATHVSRDSDDGAAPFVLSMAETRLDLPSARTLEATPRVFGHMQPPSTSQV